MSQLGAAIGPYTLVSVLGEGGMGTVYLAEQREPIRRDVALKLVRRVLDSPRARARLTVERDALARLDHPHIAKAFDAGVTQENQPYIVMELVRGEDILAYCARRQLGLEARLELFATVCNAVHHAHAKGVVHRDIKPSNILIVERPEGPEPKVIDFGLAKSLGEPLGDPWSGTQWNSTLGTFGYMSPEQASPERGPVDALSDVYSLGCVLYELLTGQVPVGRRTVDDGQFDAVLAELLTADPKRPSTVLERSLSTSRVSWADASIPDTPEGARRLAGKLEGDLDHIATRAVRRDRTARQGSAFALGDEVRRYLRGESIAAGTAKGGSSRVRLGLCVGGLALLTLALALVGGAGSQSDPAGASPTRLFVDSGQALGHGLTEAVVLGDLDGDGHLDAVIGNRSDLPNAVFLNDGRGVLVDRGPRLGARDTHDLVLADVDADGDLDLLVANSGRGSAQPDEVWINDGAGNFRDSGQRLGSTYSRALAAVDVDLDGDLDVIQGNWLGQGNRVYLNDGRGVFSDSGQDLGTGHTEALAIGDIDGDGAPDFVTANFHGEDNRVWRNDGRGRFVDPGQTVGSGATVVILLFDVDGDEDLDVFAGQFDFGAGAEDELWINREGTFVRGPPLPGAGDTVSAACGDLDGDGDLDLVVGDAERANVVLLNDGSGSYVGAGSFGSVPVMSSQDMALGDVDGDGKLDVLEGGLSPVIRDTGMPTRVFLGQ